MEYPLYVYAAGTLLALALYKVAAFAWGILGSPLRHLPGPPSESLFWGNMATTQKEDNSVPQARWVAQYGPNIAYKGVFGVRYPS